MNSSNINQNSYYKIAQKLDLYFIIKPTKHIGPTVARFYLKDAMINLDNLFSSLYSAIKQNKI